MRHSYPCIQKNGRTFMYFYFGMENEKLEKIGKAFYTTKQNGT
ncbi:conserved domain protein [Bacillus cereus 03BB102]|uniref:Conserved domain protein n=1 Tax=Bacillus cereus (strain 03BB102) TaxID=572264 RepID=A0A158RQG4_BACC3|nr:conserved domain protein [Bacillus cereus 03BB102]